MAVADAGLKLRRGYVTGAVNLYEIIREAQELLREEEFLKRLEKKESVDAKRKDIISLEKDEKKAEAVIKKTVEISKKLMDNVLNMFNTFADQQVEQMRFNRGLSNTPKAKEWVRPYGRNDLESARKTIALMAEVTAIADGIANKVRKG